MTISLSGSWIWLNGHCRSIRNGRNSREPVWLCWNWVRNRVNRSKYRFWASGGSLGWTGNILWNILSARLRLIAARLEKGIFSGIFCGSAGRLDCGSARLGSKARIWRAWTSLVFFLWRAWVRLGYSHRIFRRRVWLTPASDWADFCGSKFVLMSFTRWNDKNLFMTTLKIQISPKNTSVFWRTGLWYQLLVGETTGGGFETLGGDKTHCFISRNKKLTNTKSLIQYTPSLFLSSVSLYSLHT